MGCSQSIVGRNKALHARPTRLPPVMHCFAVKAEKAYEVIPDQDTKATKEPPLAEASASERVVVDRDDVAYL